MSSKPVKIIQISDLHLFANTDGELLGVKTQKSFEAVLDFVRKEPMDLIILTGDMTQDGSATSYLRLANMISSLNVPVYFLPGNHDNPIALEQVYPHNMITNNRHVLLKKWQIILLSSQIPGRVEGHLDESQFRYMKRQIEENPSLYTIVMFHHQPVPVGCAWLDNLGVKNADEFWDKVTQFPQVQNVIFGHVHQEFETIYRNIHCYSAPSTCIQFKRNQDAFGLENLPPGFRWIHLYDDGHLETGVRRVEEYVGVFDEMAKGY